MNPPTLPQQDPPLSFSLSLFLSLFVFLIVIIVAFGPWAYCQPILLAPTFVCVPSKTSLHFQCGHIFVIFRLSSAFECSKNTKGAGLQLQFWHGAPDTVHAASGDLHVVWPQLLQKRCSFGPQKVEGCIFLARRGECGLGPKEHAVQDPPPLPSGIFGPGYGAMPVTGASGSCVHCFSSRSGFIC